MILNTSHKHFAPAHARYFIGSAASRSWRQDIYSYIYVFDEATSNIDIESEAIIMANIKALSREKAVIVISHRLANVTPADLIYYMESGELKESGTHSELMERNSGYAKLYTTQKNLEEGYAEVGV